MMKYVKWFTFDEIRLHIVILRYRNNKDSISKKSEVKSYMLRKVVRLSFLLIGGTLGAIFLPQLFDSFSFFANPLINNPYVAAIMGALLFFVICNLFLTTPIVNLIKWMEEDRKSTRLNSSHVSISYAVFCLKKKILYHR